MNKFLNILSDSVNIHNNKININISDLKLKYDKKYSLKFSPGALRDKVSNNPISNIDDYNITILDRETVTYEIDFGKYNTKTLLNDYLNSLPCIVSNRLSSVPVFNYVSNDDFSGVKLKYGTTNDDNSTSGYTYILNFKTENLKHIFLKIYITSGSHSSFGLIYGDNIIGTRDYCFNNSIYYFDRGNNGICGHVMLDNVIANVTGACTQMENKILTFDYEAFDYDSHKYLLLCDHRDWHSGSNSYTGNNYWINLSLTYYV